MTTNQLLTLHGTRTHRRGVEKWSRRIVSLTLLAPVEKRQNEANCSWC
jgi:hypothetical protein